MNKYIVLISIVLLSFMVVMPVYSQKSVVVKQIAKTAVKSGAKTSAKAAGKQVAKDAGKEIAEQYTKRLIRREVMETAEKNGSKTLGSYFITQTKKHLKNQTADYSKSFGSYASRNKAYKNRIKYSRKGNGSKQSLAQKRIKSKTMQSKTLHSGVGKIIKRYEGKDAIAFLEKNNKEIANQIKTLMGKGGPFEHPDYHKFICEVGENGDVIVRNSHPDALSSAIKIKGNTITAYSGGTKKCGASNMFLDKPLPNKKYVVDDGKYVFSTDAKGRTSSVVAKYDKTPTEIKPSLDEGRRKLGVLDKGGNTATHDAGHITQHNLGGINEGINLVPMKNTWQRSGGEWRMFEEQEEKIIAEALSSGKTVTSSRQLVYTGDSKMPSSIIVKVMVDGKSMITKTLVCPT